MSFFRAAECAGVHETKWSNAEKGIEYDGKFMTRHKQGRQMQMANDSN